MLHDLGDRRQTRVSSGMIADEPMADRATQARIDALSTVLHHYDPAQLAYQLIEIVGEKTYLRHGIDVQKGDVVLDIGANVGVAAAFFAADCGAARVHSFEPVPPLFALLCKNVERFPACTPHDYGLSATAGQATITHYPAAAGMSGLYADPEKDKAVVRESLRNLGISKEEAEARLVDRFNATTSFRCELRTLSDVLSQESIDRVDLLKIDVEGAELDVLRGVDQDDWSRIKQAVLEVHSEPALTEIELLLRRHGFGVVIDQDPIMRGTPIHMVYAINR